MVMRKGIFTVILLSSSLSLAAIPSRDFQTPAVRHQVNTYAQQLKEDLKKAQSNSERFRAAARTSSQLRALKENSLRQSPTDEAYMDLMLSVLESIPQEKDFRRRDCNKYENDLLNQYEPLADEEPEEPAVKPGWAVLQSLCK